MHNTCNCFCFLCCICCVDNYLQSLCVVVAPNLLHAMLVPESPNIAIVTNHSKTVLPYLTVSGHSPEPPTYALTIGLSSVRRCFWLGICVMDHKPTHPLCPCCGGSITHGCVQYSSVLLHHRRISDLVVASVPTYRPGISIHHLFPERFDPANTVYMSSRQVPPPFIPFHQPCSDCFVLR